jgi:hypothetical protein
MRRVATPERQVNRDWPRPPLLRNFISWDRLPACRNGFVDRLEAHVDMLEGYPTCQPDGEESGNKSHHSKCDC